MKRPFKSDKEKMTLSDAARVLGVCRRTINRGIAEGLLVPVRHGLCRHAYWVTRASVNALLKRGGAA